MYAVLTRFRKEEKSTLGAFVIYDVAKVWECLSLELPDRDNQPKISCIPEGTYQCKYTFSNHFQKFFYEVLNVSGRAGIRIHPANFAQKQLLGCIALGKSHTDMDKDGSIDITDSRKTVAEFEKIMKHEPFKLIIRI